MPATVYCGLLALASLCLLAACAGTGEQPQSIQARAVHGWNLVWSDEFDQGRIDPAKWQHEINCAGGGNNEAQCYTDRPENSYVDADGLLHIVAREERFSGPAHSQGSADYRADDRSASRDYTSARLRTMGRLDFKYGRIEVRARLPAGQGTWPAIWMLPSDQVYGGWPSSGEIDIVEAVNLDDAADEHAIHGTLHYGLKWPQWSVAGAEYHIPGSATREFRTYALEWEADEMRWFVDDVHYQTQTSAGWYNYIWRGQREGFRVATARAPFDQDFHLLLNLAIGGHAPGPADRGWTRDREFLVDYVRIYSCSVDPESGSGCGTVSNDPTAYPVTMTQDSGAPRIKRFGIFDDTAETLILEHRDRVIDNKIVIRPQANQTGSVEFETVDTDGTRGRVLDIRFDGAGQVALATASMLEIAGVADGFALRGGQAWTNHGTIEFDLLVEQIDPGTSLMARLGGRAFDFGQVKIDTGEVGTWQPVAIRIADLLANPHATGSGIDINHLQYLFAIAASGTGKARIRVDNIAMTCAVNENSKSWQPSPTCSIGPVPETAAITASRDIFVDAETLWAAADCCGGATTSIVDDDLEPERGKVVEFRYQTDTTVTHFQSEAPMDFTALAGGTLEFDLLIVSDPDKPTTEHPWLMSASCGHPCGAANLPLSASVEGIAAVVGRWQHFTFDLDELASRGLDLKNVVVPLAIFPSWGNQQGAVFRVDNVVVRAPARGAIKLAD